MDPSDWRKPIVDFIKDPNLVVDRKVKQSALNYIILGNTLFRKSVDGNLLTCLGEKEAYITITEVYEGICGSHQVGEKMKCILYNQRVFWPSLVKDCIEYAKPCQECQKHGHIQHLPASELHAIVKTLPFRSEGGHLI